MKRKPKAKHVRRSLGGGGFAEVVRRWRVARKLTKAAAARQLGIPYRTLQDWELGNRIPRGYVRQLITEKLST